MFAIINTYFNLLTYQGPGRGYHTEISKSVLIVHPENTKAGKVFDVRHKFKMRMGAHYISVYIEDDESKRDCLYADVGEENFHYQ